MADTPGLAKYYLIEIDEVDYAEYATTALLTGDAPVQQLRTLVPDGVITDTDSAAYTFQLAGPQGTPLYAALVAAEGETVSIVFQTEPGTSKAVRTFTATVPAGLAFGGAQGAWKTFDISMPVTGAPVPSVSA